MEMSYEVRVQIDAPSSSQSSSGLSSPSTTTSSSSPAAPPSPAAAADQTPSPSSSPSLLNIADRSRTLALESLNRSIPHSMRLKELQHSDKNYQKEAMKIRKGVRRLSKEIYHIVSIYAVLQGVLFAAVAQTTIFTCQDWWGPVFMAGAVTVGTLSGVVEKLRSIGVKKVEAEKFEERRNAVYDKIDLLYWKGDLCRLEDLEPEHNSQHPSHPGLAGLHSLHALLVLGFLAVFSALIIASCYAMLCTSTCKCSPHP